MIVRDAQPRDLPEILVIHNAAIVDTTANWDDEPTELPAYTEWFEQRRAQFPFLVAEIDGRVAGYASYAQWRPKTGYRHTVENSVYVGADFQRRGVASALLAELISRARTAGLHAIVAGIESGNLGSIKLHEQFGFRIVGQLPEVGTKFGRWLDLTLMQLSLDAA